MIRAGLVGRNDKSERIEFDFEGDELDVCGDTEWDGKGRTMISHIYVSFDQVIRSIQFGYLENNGTLVLSEKYGLSSDYGNFRVERLDEDEYVTGLCGARGLSGGIKYLTFCTNRGKHGPIGNSEGQHGSKVEINPAICDRREFGGFFGSYTSTCLTSIGMYFSPIVGSSQRTIKRENI